MKKFLVLKPLMAVLAVLLSINAWAHDAEIDGICYNLNATTHTAEVTFKMEYFPEYDGYSNVSNYYSGDVVIPESVEYEGAIYSVTSIGFCAFVQCDGLTSVSIPNSVTSVSLQIFEGCPHLTDVFCYAESVPTADDVAFMSVDMENVTLHVPAASINAYMETVPWGDFEKIVALGDAPVIVGDNCIGGIYYNFDEETLTAEVIQGENEYEGDVIIPGSVEYGGSTYVVTSIRENAFNNCKRLTTVTIPKSVTRIGDQAFSSCKGLSDVYCYGEDVPDMLWDVFYDSTPKFKTLHVPDAFVELYADDAQWGTFGTILPLSVESPVSVKVSDIYYLFNGEEQTAVVTRGPDGYEGDVDIPANVTYDGITYAVTEIGNLAFNDCSDLTFVSIPDGVKRIGYRAFWGCKSLEYVDVPESVTSIVDEAFSECENVDLTIPDNVTSIGEFAFYNCYNLTSANLPEGLTEVSAFAFYGCQSLTSVVIPEGVTSIGTYAFARCGDLTSVVIPEGMTIIDVEAFSMCSKLSSVTIPEGVEEIGRWGFASCWSLTSVTLPSSLKYLDYGVFSGCGDLTDVYCYAEEVPTTDADVFLYLPDATLHVPAASIDAYLSESPWSDFYQIASLEDGIPVVIERSWAELIPNGDCETAYEHVFAIAKEVPVDGSDLHQARVVDGVGVDGSKGIEVRASNRLQYAWDNQFWIYEPYELPSGTKYVIEFDYKAAKENETVINTESHALPSNWLGNGIGGVYFTDEWQHFKYESRASDGLRSIAFSLSGNSDANIYYFDNISFKVLADAIEGLEPVYVDDQYPVVEYEDTGEEPDVMELVHVDGISYVVNKNKLVATVTSGGSYEGSVKIPSAFTYYSGEDDAFVEDVMVTEIGSLAFADCRSLLSVTIPEGVAQIKDYAFSGCDAMQRVIIPSTVTTVRHHAFQGCLSLADVYCYATSVPETENDVFASVPVSDVTLHVPASAIDAYMETEPWNGFGNIVPIGDDEELDDIKVELCYEYDEVAQTATVVSGNGKYEGDIVIPSSVEKAGVTYSVTAVGDYAFDDCYNLTSVTIPESVTTIGDVAFFACSALTSVRIPNSVKNLGVYAFSACDGLTDVYCFAKDVPETNVSAFDNVEVENVTLHVPASSIEYYMYAEPWSNFGTIVALEEETPVLAGDANGDGSVNVFDVTATVNYILGSPIDAFVFEAADLNNDEVVNVFDVTKMVNIILGVDAAEAKMRGVMAVDDTGMMTALSDGKNQNLVVDNAERYVAMQFDVIVPTGHSVEGVILNSSADHVLSYQQIDTNCCRVIVYSMQNASFEPTGEALVSLKQASGASIENAVFVTTDGRCINMTVADEATGVEIAELPEDVGAIYNLSGQYMGTDVNALSKGTYIRNHKKFIVK